MAARCDVAVTAIGYDGRCSVFKTVGAGKGILSTMLIDCYPFDAINVAIPVAHLNEKQLHFTAPIILSPRHEHS